MNDENLKINFTSTRRDFPFSKNQIFQDNLWKLFMRLRVKDIKIDTCDGNYNE